MKVKIDTEDRTFVEKLAKEIVEPVLYIIPRYQQDCFGIHEVYRFEILEKQVLIQDSDVLQIDNNEFPFPVFQDKNPIFTYPSRIEFGTHWTDSGMELFIRKIIK